MTFLGRHVLRLLGATALTMLVAGSCSPDYDLAIPEPEAPTDPSADSPEPEPPGSAELAGTFVPGPCPFDVPGDATIECGTVTVPENYDDPLAGGVDLAVAVLASTDDNPAATPTIYLEGGPGGHALETIPFVYADRYAPLLDHADVIVFDQRGVGQSLPRLDCPEVDAVYDANAVRPDLDVDTYRQSVLDGLAACHQRLSVAGIDLGQYNTANNADDVDRIRQALGVDQLDLFGISYGTRLGLEVMKRHPDIVRTAVLDSTLPPEVDATADTQASLVRSYERVLAACAADTDCAGRFPFLDERFRALYEELEADPLPATATNFLTASTDDVLIDGDALLVIVLGALYDPIAFTDLPELIVDLEAGGVEVAESFLSLDATNEAFFTPGLLFSFACHDEVPFSSPDAVDAAQPADVLWERSLETSENVGSFAFEVCEAWPAGQAPASQNEPVTGSIPTLLLAGYFDPVTPPEWAEQAATHLDNAQVVTFPTLAHGVTGDPCGMQIAAAFIVEPDTLDISCVDQLEPPAFLTVPVESIELEPYSVDIADFGISLSSVRPVGWTADATGVQSSRSASITDETAIVQLGGPALIADQLGSVVGDQLDMTITEEDPEEIGGRSWRHLVGSSPDGFTLDLWVEQGAELAPIVILISAADDQQILIDGLAIPALEAIEVEPI